MVKPEEDQGMTYNELVKEYFPGATDEECNFILWEKTAFPMCSIETLRDQLEKHANEEHTKDIDYEPNCCECEFTYDGGECDNCEWDD